MKKKLLHFLLLFSLFLNITHDTVLSMESDCHSKSVQKYVAQSEQSAQCNDVCDMHNMFHFVAIVEYSSDIIESNYEKEKNLLTRTLHIAPLQKTAIRPPIA